jgi:TetR/AcrR family transcriptional regulator, tetracycline repressor protein
MTCTTYSCQVTSPSGTAGTEPEPGQADAGRPDAGRADADRARLTKSAVIDQALKLADSVGLEALTIRKLTTELGVTPMALYWHFRSKEELLTGLAERVWSEIDLEVDRSAPWPDQVRTLFESLLAVLRTHPAAAKLLEFGKQTEASLRPTELTLEILREAGFDPEHAAGIARYALWNGIMLVMSEPGSEWLSLEERVQGQRKKQITFATLPPETYPQLVECAVPMTSSEDPEFHYQLGVDLFIAGLEAIAAKRG